MKRTPSIILGITFILLIPFITSAQDKFTDFLRKELHAHADELKKQEFPPYYMNYRVVDEQMARVVTSFGVLTAKENNRERTLVPQMRIGSPEFDNFKIKQMGTPISRFHGPSYALLPIDDTNEENATRQAIWNEVNNRYKHAIDAYQTARAETTINVAEEDKAPCFSAAPAEKYYEAPLPADRTTVDLNAWEKRLKEISAVFKKHPKILRGDASFRYTVKRIYVLDTDGTEVVQNLTYARIMVQGATKADDGMELPLVLSYFAHTPGGSSLERANREGCQHHGGQTGGIAGSPDRRSLHGTRHPVGKCQRRVLPRDIRTPHRGATHEKRQGRPDLQKDDRGIRTTRSPASILRPDTRELRGQDMNGYYKYR